VTSPKNRTHTNMRLHFLFFDEVTLMKLHHQRIEHIHKHAHTKLRHTPGNVLWRRHRVDSDWLEGVGGCVHVYMYVFMYVGVGVDVMCVWRHRVDSD